MISKFLLEAILRLCKIYSHMKKSLLSKAIFACAAISAASALTAETIKMVGSDIIAEKISAEILERVKERSLDVNLNMLGTRQALADLAKNNAHIAIIAIPDGTKKLDGYQAVPYAHQVATVLVNSSNPIEEITTTQLAQIYGADTADNSSLQNFGESSDKTAVRNILPMVSSLKESIAVEVFKAKCLGSANMALKVETKKSTPELALTIKTGGNTIGIAAFDPQLEGVKVLAVSDTSKNSVNAFAFKPTMENVHNNDYPLKLDFFIVFKDENLQKIKPLLQILLEDNMLDTLEKSGLMPAPKNFVRSYLLGLDINK